MISLAIIFGTNGKEDGPYAKSWDNFQSLVASQEGDEFLVLRLWQKMVGVFRHRIQVYNGREALDRLPEVKQLCKLLGVEYAELEKKAATEIPMSKALQNLLAAKESKQKKNAEAKSKQKTTKGKGGGGDDPAWSSECDEALKHSWSYLDYEKRWAARRKAGLTDAELRDAISEEYGEDAWKTGGGLKTHVKGGRNILFEAKLESGKVVKLKGAKLVAKVREVMEIPYPTNETTTKKTEKKKPKDDLNSIVSDLQFALEAAADTDEDSIIVSPRAFVQGRKIKVIYNPSAVDNDDLLTPKQATKYLAWLNEGNIGKYSEMK
jgi:hypothetical protein